MSDRLARVAEEFREILAEELPRLKDPRVGFVTITGVRVSPDMKKAYVAYSVLGDDKAWKGTRAALRSSTKHLRSVVGREVRLKFTPELICEEDRSAEDSARIDRVLAEARRPHDDD
ncbi:MAG: 30S ribosome-binding factor RbfA [Actinomycetota bacterium]